MRKISLVSHLIFWEKLNMKIQKKFILQDSQIYHIYKEEKHIGSIETIEEKDHTYIENIFLDEEFRGCGFLKKILNEFSAKPLKCLPLSQHRKKFEHLGFHVCEINGEDVYYIR